ncbi:TVP38/TMEM64 family protein [Corynebacterium bovis]|uniref:TVP38/TMEM64 family protein n=1 Tax=Corynebacterium bovis TaxID=36808 RepID=UPI002446B930|nr:TVP38/TMEM64 family protein [Corynebacterium bovis]MDH2454964.1 TVP38/TMEM64 family protein [Corynebacterium bovis]
MTDRDDGTAGTGGPLRPRDAGPGGRPGWTRWPRWAAATWGRVPTRMRLAGLAAVIVIVVVVVLVPVPAVGDIRDTVRSTGAWAPAVYLVAMVLFTQVPFPRTVWTVSAGVLFGPVLGCAAALAGLLASATVSLILVRSAARSVVRRSGRGRAPGRLAVLADILEERGWVAVLGLRMVPAVPFSLLNYACGVSTVPALPYLAATVAGSAPGTVVTVLATDALATDGDPRILGVSALLAVVGVVLTVRESRVIRARARQRTRSGDVA